MSFVQLALIYDLQISNGIENDENEKKMANGIVLIFVWLNIIIRLISVAFVSMGQ